MNLTIADSAAYLGMIIDAKRIKWATNIHKQVPKAQNFAHMLLPAGLNGTGIAPSASVILYKTFIRPVMEYGLQRNVVEPVLQKPMQRCQNLVLRAIIVASRRASINVFHKILRIP